MEPWKKKSLFDDQAVAHTTAQLKGRRLRMVRALAGFSRQELYEKIGISTSTIDTWESGRVELTDRSSIRVCDAFKKIGVHCTSEWLLTGNGDPPRLMRDVEKSIFVCNDADYNRTDSNVEELTLKGCSIKLHQFIDEDVRKELSFFINLHKNALFHIVEDDFMNFRYRKSDCVAGEMDDLKNLEGCVIIAQLDSGRTTLCKLIRCLGEESEITFAKHNHSENAKIAKAAEIVWHRTARKGKR
ncbi:MAG: helix-turn-helix domain-containing protein [Holosporaceae bacterium]|nr:helix-turn-helix domain-containing protein [Holosporaceae bacterium]